MATDADNEYVKQARAAASAAFAAVYGIVLEDEVTAAADAVFDYLLSLSVEKRMEAMRMREIRGVHPAGRAVWVEA